MKTKLILSLAVLLGFMVACQQPNQKSMTATSQKVGAVEVVIYQTKAGVDEATALQKAKSVNEFVKSQQGFIERRMSKTEDRKWVDIIFWESVEAAQKANEKAMQSSEPLAFFEIIDETTMTFLHAKTAFEVVK